MKKDRPYTVKEYIKLHKQKYKESSNRDSNLYSKDKIKTNKNSRNMKITNSNKSNRFNIEINNKVFFKNSCIIYESCLDKKSMTKPQVYKHKSQIKNNIKHKNLNSLFIIDNHPLSTINKHAKVIKTEYSMSEEKLNKINNNISKENCVEKIDAKIFYDLLEIHYLIEMELNKIIKINATKDKNDLYRNLFKILNNFFNKLTDYISNNNQIIFIENEEFNKKLLKLFKQISVLYSLFFVICVLFLIQDSLILIKKNYYPIFKKISLLLYNIFYDHLNNDIFENDNYKQIINYINSNNYLTAENKANLTKISDEISSDIKQNIENLKFNKVYPVISSINQLLINISYKTFSTFIYIITNTILYSLLDKNIQKVYKNKDKLATLNNPKYYSNNTVPYLPPAKFSKYTLVLDLDETLIHFFCSKIIKNHGVYYGYLTAESNGVFIDFKDNNFFIPNDYEYIDIGIFLLRPYVKLFLEELKNYYEIVIFTTGTKEYCDRIIDIIDLNENLINYRLYKHHISLNNTNTIVKDLSLLGRDLKKVIIIDNLEENFRLQKDNGLSIKTWEGDINDNELKYLMEILKKIVINKVSDVRKVIKKIKLQLFTKTIVYSKINIDAILLNSK